jgi:hypothetical protein
MKATIEKGYLKIDAADLIDHLDDAGRAKIIELLSCHDTIIENVAAQIVDGWTEAGSHGGRCFGPLPHTPLDKARRRLAESASEVAKEDIKRLAQQVVDTEKRLSDVRDKFYKAENRISDLLGELRRYQVPA